MNSRAKYQLHLVARIALCVLFVFLAIAFAIRGEYLLMITNACLCAVFMRAIYGLIWT